MLKFSTLISRARNTAPATAIEYGLIAAAIAVAIIAVAQVLVDKH